MGTLNHLRAALLTSRASSTVNSSLPLLWQRHLSKQPTADRAQTTRDPFALKVAQKAEKDLAELEKTSRATDPEDDDRVNVRLGRHTARMPLALSRMLPKMHYAAFFGR
jgi:hypothetical protein